MKLGMPKSAIMPALEGKYKLSQVAGQDSWGIMEKDGPPYKLVGQITFKDGLLAWASKDWGSFGEDGAEDFANELFSVLSNLNQEGKSVAMVTATTVVRQPGLTVNGIELVFGSKKITILISAGENSGRSKLSIQEILQNQ